MNQLNKIFDFKSSGIKAGKGKMLISEPFLPDFYFKRSVLLIADHSLEEGSFGLIINKKTEYTVDQITANFTSLNCPVYLGGPVQTDSLFYLHRRNDLIPDSMEIIPGVFWGGNIDRINELVLRGLISKDDVRFYLGYSGWTKNQLTKELKEKAWLVSHISSNEVFSDDPESLWEKSIQKMGNDFRHWLNFPTNPQWN